ncbi:MAG: tetratricopeptide repeat protein [Elusimicrobia bacterium]|nr:tetratricopeptide repeat protein [Elusimicrobiota bacterium]
MKPPLPAPLIIWIALVASTVSPAHSGQYDKDIETQRARTQQNPGDLDAALSLGNYLSWDGHYQEALEVFQGIIQREPKFTDAEIAMARVYSWMGDQEKAKALFTGLLERHPDKSEIYQGLGLLSLWANDYAAGIEHFEKALRANPKDIVSLKSIGRAYLGKGDRRRAEDFFTKAQILEIQRLPAAYWLLGASGIASMLALAWLITARSARRKKEHTLKLELELLRAALDLYRQNTGKYPLSLEQLKTSAWKPEGKNQEKNYLNGLIGQGEKGVLVDVFSRRFWYNPDTGRVRSNNPAYEDW